MFKNRKIGFFYGNVIVFVGFVNYMFGLGSLTTFGVFFKPISADFGWTRAMVSGAHSLCYFSYGVFGFILGRLSDQFGPRVVVTFCCGLTGLGVLLMSQIDGIWKLYLFYGVMVGIGVAGNFAPMQSTIAKWFIKRRGRMMAIAGAGFGAGGFIMPLLASWLIARFGWRTSYLVLGGVISIVSIPITQLIRRNPSEVGQFPDGGEQGVGDVLNEENEAFYLSEAVRTRQLWMIAGIWMFHGFWSTAVMLHIVPYATDIGIPAGDAANILSIIGGVHIIGRLIMGSVADRIGSKPSFMICLVIVVASLFLLQSADQLWMLYLFAAIFGFGNYGLAALISVLAADLFGVRALGAILGVVAAFFGIGTLLGPTSAGRIFDLTQSYRIAFLVCTALSVISLAFSGLLSKPMKRK